MRPLFPLLISALLCLLPTSSVAADDEDFFKPKENPKETNPSGTAEMLRQMPKKWGVLKEKDEAKNAVTVHLDGDKEPTTWTINPDAELKLYGTWVRLQDFAPSDRVWVWFDVNRKRQSKSVLMMCDETTQQEMNDRPNTLTALDVAGNTVTLKSLKGDAKVWKFGSGLRLEGQPDACRVLMARDGADAVTARDLKPGVRLYARTQGDNVVALLDAQGLEALRQANRETLRQTWIREGLPGTVVFLHPLSGEMEVMLDHEALRWGRWLKLGDKVKIKAGEPLVAAVKESRPWRERTQVRLVVDGFAQHDLSLGQRVTLQVPTPPAEMDTAELPPDIDRPRGRTERIEWFLASTYCSCTVGGNGCTGMFYTLSSCNIHGCGMPNAMRKKIGLLIDVGKSDRQIWDELKKSNGPAMLRPHLVP